jgi:hypothetical protein
LLAAQRFSVGASVSAYRCTAYRQKPAADHFEIKELGIAADDWQAGKSGRDLGAAINWTRALVDAPANVLTPQAFASELHNLKSLGIDVEILDVAALRETRRRRPARGGSRLRASAVHGGVPLERSQGQRRRSRPGRQRPDVRWRWPQHQAAPWSSRK